MKILLTALLILFSMLGHSQIPTTGLLACYSFDSNANDEFNSNDGTLIGGATANNFLETGGNALDALSIPGTVLNNVSEFSIAHKVNFKNFNINHQSSSNVIFSGATESEDNLMNFAYSKDQLIGGSATLRNTVFYIYDNSIYKFEDIDLETGIWYHFALVRGADTVKFYLDGVEQVPTGDLSLPSLNLSLHPDGFIFGQDQDVLAGGFQDFQSLNGAIDNLLLYDRELTNQEVLDVYNSANGCVFVNNEEIESSLPKIYPNPTKNTITVELKAPREVIVTNVYGQILISQKMWDKVNILDVSFLKSGNYFIEIDNLITPIIVD